MTRKESDTSGVRGSLNGLYRNRNNYTIVGGKKLSMT